MGKISQSDAAIAARKICEPINQKANAIEMQLREYVTELWKETIPADVMKMFSKHPEYMKTTSSVKVAGQGIGKDRSTALIGSWPSDKGEYYVTLNLTNQQAQKAVKLIDAKEAMSKKFNATQDEVESTILNLGTHKRVLNEFPEAYGSLPGVNTNTALAVELQPVRDKVRCLVSEDAEKKCIDKI